MGLRVTKRICANSSDELRTLVNQFKAKGWNEGRTITTAEGYKGLECYVWKDLGDDYRRQIVEQQKQIQRREAEEKQERFG